MAVVSDQAEVKCHVFTSRHHRLAFGEQIDKIGLWKFRKAEIVSMQPVFEITNIRWWVGSVSALRSVADYFFGW
jgi:hypothetical protein